MIVVLLIVASNFKIWKGNCFSEMVKLVDFNRHIFLVSDCVV